MKSFNTETGHSLSVHFSVKKNKLIKDQNRVERVFLFINKDGVELTRQDAVRLAAMLNDAVAKMGAR